MKVRLPLLFEGVVVFLEFGLDDLKLAPLTKRPTVKKNCFIELVNYYFNNCFLYYVIVSVTLQGFSQ